MHRLITTAVTWRALGGCFGGVGVVSVDGFGALLLLLRSLWAGPEHGVHVLHELQLLAPQVLLPDELPARPLVLLLLPLLLRLPPEKPTAHGSHSAPHRKQTLDSACSWQKVGYVSAPWEMVQSRLEII